MSRRLLINAQKPEELRIAILHGNKLESYQVEVAEGGVSRGNIYRGVVANLQPSLNAAFIDFGQAKHGFLSIQDVVPESYTRKPKKEGRPHIDEVLEKGKPILVQVSKDMDGKKGAALTTNISLAGRYLVLTPYDDKRGVSRKVEDEETRQQLRDMVDKLKLPAGSGFIIRTNALEQNKTTISRDFAAVLRLWKTITSDFKKGGKEPALLHNDQDIVVRALRDFCDAAIDEVLVDTDEAFEKAQEYMRVSMPRAKTQLVRYTEREPLFSRFGLESQIDSIYDRRVSLPSGGSIVIDRTEALTAIDVNSGRSTKAATQEETALNTNVEAAVEIARQLRLRDIGGLVVVDFIDMRSSKYRSRVEKELSEAMKVDKARHQVGRISSNGLVEINRQRIRKELYLQTHRSCPTCEGTGRIASTEMVSLNLLRRIEARASTTSLESVRIELHPELADAFQNSRRHQIVDLENEFGIRIDVIAASRLHRPEQIIEWHDSPKGEKPHHHPVHVPDNHAAPAAPVAPTEAQPEGDHKKKRRRRRRGKGQADAIVGHPADRPIDDLDAGIDEADGFDDMPGFDMEPGEAEAAVVEVSEASALAEASNALRPDHHERSGKRRRRRRGKGRGGDAHPVAVEGQPDANRDEASHARVVTEAEAEPAVAADHGSRMPDNPPAETQERSGKRRRRRGGRSRGKAGDAPPVDLVQAASSLMFVWEDGGDAPPVTPDQRDHTKDTAPEPAHLNESSPTSESGAAPPHAGPRKRRRRGGRARKKGDTAAPVVSSDGDES